MIAEAANAALRAVKLVVANNRSLRGGTPIERWKHNEVVGAIRRGIDIEGVFGRVHTDWQVGSRYP
jgi:hypothetical protein